MLKWLIEMAFVIAMVTVGLIAWDAFAGAHVCPSPLAPETSIRPEPRPED